jgi:hypothetical protein
MGTINGTATSKIGEKISARVKSHTFCPDENPESALVHDEAPRGEAAPLATKSITDASAIPQLLQNFVVSTICTPHLGQNISIIPLPLRRHRDQHFKNSYSRMRVTQSLRLRYLCASMSGLIPRTSRRLYPVVIIRIWRALDGLRRILLQLLHQPTDGLFELNVAAFSPGLRI